MLIYSDPDKKVARRTRAHGTAHEGDQLQNGYDVSDVLGLERRFFWGRKTSLRKTSAPLQAKHEPEHIAPNSWISPTNVAR